MKYWAVTVSSLPAQAMALYPFMLFKRKNLREDESIIRHEQIHFRQQQELLIVFFYPIYLLNYLVNLARYRDHSTAYFNISFEREAYQNESDLTYLNKRKLFAWTRLL
jgi:hypothetical protein